MARKNISVFGLYPSRDSLREGLDALQRAGYRGTDVSVLLPENLGNKDLSHKKGSKSPEGATAGAASGAVLGGATGWLAGIGMLTIPGLGPFLAAGPIMAALAGVGAGAVVGGLAGGLVGMGIPEYEAKRYEGRIKEGGILLSVHCDNSDWEERARRILTETGAQDVDSASEASADYATTDQPVLRR